MAIKTIKDLMPDSHNANKGTVRGAKMIEASLQQDGFGRPVLVDKNGQLIAGNKTVQGVAVPSKLTPAIVPFQSKAGPTTPAKRRF